MDFLSTKMMSGRAKLPRVIYVKPYMGPGSDSDSGEKENLGENNFNSPHRGINTQVENKAPGKNGNVTDVVGQLSVTNAEEKEKNPFAMQRTHSLDHMVGMREASDEMNNTTLGRERSFERKQKTRKDTPHTSPAIMVSSRSPKKKKSLSPIRRKVNW